MNRKDFDNWANEMINEKNRLYKNSIGHLHTALYLLEEHEVTAAYQRICWAIMKLGDEMTEREAKIFNELRIDNLYKIVEKEKGEMKND